MTSALSTVERGWAMTRELAPCSALVYESEDDAEDARSRVTGTREAGVRGDKLVVFSGEIGPADRVAIEECFPDGEGGSS